MTDTSYLHSSHAIVKILIMLVGYITTIVSYYSYEDQTFSTHGVNEKCHDTQRHGGGQVKWIVLERYEYHMDARYCPNMVLERSLLWIHLLILTIETLSFIACCFASIETVNVMRNRDAAYHVVAAVFLFILSIVMIISSANLASNGCKVVDLVKQKTHLNSNFCNSYLLVDWQFASAGLSFLVSSLYIAEACILENVRLYGMYAPSLFNKTAERRNSPSKPNPQLLTRRKSRVMGSSNSAAGLTVPGRRTLMSEDGAPVIRLSATV